MTLSKLDRILNVGLLLIICCVVPAVSFELLSSYFNIPGTYDNLGALSTWISAGCSLVTAVVALSAILNWHNIKNREEAFKLPQTLFLETYPNFLSKIGNIETKHKFFFSSVEINWQQLVLSPLPSLPTETEILALIKKTYKIKRKVMGLKLSVFNIGKCGYSFKEPFAKFHHDIVDKAQKYLDGVIQEMNIGLLPYIRELDDSSLQHSNFENYKELYYKNNLLNKEIANLLDDYFMPNVTNFNYFKSS